MSIERIVEIESLKNNSDTTQPVDNSPKTVDKSIPSLAPKKQGRGGARKGAGRPKGKMEKRSIEKMMVKKEVENRIAKHAQKLLTAQLSVALGTQFLFMRYMIETPKGKRWSRFERVEDPDVMRQYLDGELKDRKTEYYMITAEKPDVGTIDSLLDRTFGRAPQNLNIKDDRPDPIATILGKFGLLDEEGNSNAGKTQDTSEASS